ncbi:glycoside hydrolase family 16 protein [Aspergillus ibericus CBS 121593]|uniref:chitinase n=1 Tax=Aspergillus ibericus CBS 121593 TaxID=1448316 RepID=A0A395H6R6_9EURO|nr:concanavalin A-like lectin/glucanase [Aspergillus ibericus CBS 121593]RAL03249.1 concanavalin A-like lectin/glucanase [Aspergillus ibericus CBS 121593]
MKSYMQWAVTALAAVPLCAAQTYSSCNPLNKTCPADKGLNQWSFSTNFTVGESAFDRWNTTAGTVNSTSKGAEFKISEQGDAPTIESNFYIFFGYVEVTFRAANGTGIISTSVLESNDLDEIDWEQVSTYDDEIQTNYFGKGNTTSYDRATTVNVTTPEETYHTYGVNWTASKTEWIRDGVVVRTLEYADAVDGKNYPQTPMTIRVGIWAGGDPDNSAGTIEWAGGETDYDDGPFIMYLESVKVINYNPAEYYNYTDKTGDYTSIHAYNLTSSKSTNSNSSSSGSSSTGTSSSSSSSTSTSTSSSGATGLSTSGSLMAILAAALLAGLL